MWGKEGVLIIITCGRELSCTVTKAQLNLIRSVSTIDENFHQNDYHFRGRSQYYLYILYNLFKVLCLSFCQIPSPYQDSHMQIICGNPADPVFQQLTIIKSYADYRAKLQRKAQLRSNSSPFCQQCLAGGT